VVFLFLLLLAACFAGDEEPFFFLGETAMLRRGRSSIV
jgi:hypothetical protein